MICQQKPQEGKKQIDNNTFEIVPLNLSHMEKMAAIGLLSSSVAHEMRNLLGMIRTATFNINRAVKSADPTILNNMEIINRSINRAREYIDNLLNLSRLPENGSKEDVIDITKTVDNLLTLFSKEMEWRRIRLVRDYQTLPAFRLNCNALQECLLNLILNAIQCMENGGIITISIHAWNEGVRISVTDTGCGISAEEILRIFDHFYTTKKNGQGTGLGLSIARSLAQDLGGDISVASTVGNGSTFSIEIPSLFAISTIPAPEKGSE